MPIPVADIPKHFVRWCRGDEHAAKFLLLVAAAARLADDIADGDSSDPHFDMARLLSIGFNDVHQNPFFRAHAAVLGPLLAVAAAEWSTAETWAKSSSRKTRVFGFVYRESVERVAHMVAFLTGGIDHAAQVIVELHAVAHSGGETPEQWEAEHGTVRA